MNEEKTIKISCDGCLEDLEMALEIQKKGYFIATNNDYDMDFESDHVFFMIVNENGKVIIE